MIVIVCFKVRWDDYLRMFLQLLHQHHLGKIHRKMVLECLLQTRPDQEWGKIGQASLLHSWHWVLLLWWTLFHVYFNLLQLTEIYWISCIVAREKVSSTSEDLIWSPGTGRPGWSLPPPLVCFHLQPQIFHSFSPILFQINRERYFLPWWCWWWEV